MSVKKYSAEQKVQADGAQIIDLEEGGWVFHQIYVTTSRKHLIRGL